MMWELSRKERINRNRAVMAGGTLPTCDDGRDKPA